MVKGLSIAKPSEHLVNEDAVRSNDHCIAVSDGAGGCGVYANDWSSYLIDNLPSDKPIRSFEDLDGWIEGIWEPYYDEHERMAQNGDSMLLEKFYKEGSYATLAAAWFTDDGLCHWLCYGDSVVFHYSPVTRKLEHSFTALSHFSNPPHLISCKEPLDKSGFRSGVFELDDKSLVFVASDALSHFILMNYELAHCGDYRKDLDQVRESANANAQLLAVAESMPVDFDKLLVDLVDSLSSEEAFKSHLLSLCEQGVLDKDDFSLVVWCRDNG